MATLFVPVVFATITLHPTPTLRLLTVTFNAFMEGQVNPDVAELIKPALTLYLMKLADDVDAPFKLYAEDPQSNEISDVELFRTMKQRNPEMFTQLKENVNQGLRMAKAKPVEQPQQRQQAPQNFLEMGDVEMVLPLAALLGLAVGGGAVTGYAGEVQRKKVKAEEDVSQKYP